MKNGIIISDTGPIFSLAILDQLELLTIFFEEAYIPKAVWEELTLDETDTTLYFRKSVPITIQDAEGS